jgi:hypothetical protein
MSDREFKAIRNKEALEALGLSQATFVAILVGVSSTHSSFLSDDPQ